MTATGRGDAATGTSKILLVDDDESQRVLVARTLSRGARAPRLTAAHGIGVLKCD